MDGISAKSQGKRCGLELGVTNNTASVHDNIIYNNRDTDSVSDISDLSGGSSTFFNNISTDPTFEEGWYLDIGGTGAIDAGSDTIINLVISGTTQTDGSADVNVVDLGYHYVTGSTAVDATNSTAVLINVATIQNATETLTIIPNDVDSAIIGAVDGC